MNFFLSSRWSVRLALIIIALLALIALTSQWWAAYDPPVSATPASGGCRMTLRLLICRRACSRRMRSTGWAPII